jgi:hypothetical protein
MKNKERYIARAANVAARMIGGEVMIMSGLDSSLFSLNATASVLWQAADGVTPLSAIVEERICTAFEVDPAEALRDAEEVAEALAGHGILRLSDSPLPDAGAPAPGSP